MTDPTPQTTPTRDEAVRKLMAELQYRQAVDMVNRMTDAEMAAILSQMVEQITEQAKELVQLRASAPAPASGGVNAVAVKALMKAVQRAEDGAGTIPAKEAVKLRPADWHAVCDRARAIASLSPAATPVSEAEPDWMEAQQVRKRRGVEIMQEYAWGNLTPLGVANHLMRAGFNIDYAQKVANDLAKPASSPAPVRPIGNQGISDYQREIARNMAEGFAAWNAARQEALPSDEPASSPAGGDVVEALKRIAEHPEKYDDGVQSYDVGFAFWNVQKIARNALAALSQSTSAGRVGE